MQVVLIVLLALTALIAAVLWLPIYLILKNDENQPLIFRFRILGKTFDPQSDDGEKPKQKPEKKQSQEENPIVEMLKKILGIHRFEKEHLERKVRKGGLSATVGDSVHILLELLEQVVDVIRGCTAVKFRLKLVCASEDPADAAIRYGRYCAIVYPLIGYVSSVMHLPRKGRDIDIRCDMVEQKKEFTYHLVVRLHLFYVLRAFIRIVLAESKRTRQEQQKNL